MSFKNWPKIDSNFGVLLFLISFMLPAYAVGSKVFYGYQCAYMAPAIAVSGDIEGGILVQILTRVHFFLLGLHNVLLPISLLQYRKITDGNYHWVLNFFATTSVNTILFFFYDKYMASTMHEDLQIGYYLWVLSSVLILISLILIWRKQTQ